MLPNKSALGKRARCGQSSFRPGVEVPEPQASPPTACSGCSPLACEQSSYVHLVLTEPEVVFGQRGRQDGKFAAVVDFAEAAPMFACVRQPRCSHPTRLADPEIVRFLGQ